MLGVARRDRHLRARGPLALAHQLGDVLRERLGAERRLAQHHLADRLVDDLLEARHVRALLVALEVDEALQAREEQLVADAHHLLHAGDAHAREAHRHRRRTRLHVLAARSAWETDVAPRRACTAAKPSARLRASPLRPSGAIGRRFWYHSAHSSVNACSGKPDSRAASG